MPDKPKPIPLSPVALDAIERHLEAFRRKFGRDPTDNDPTLFDPDADEPVPLSEEKYERMMVEAMVEIGISQAMIFRVQADWQDRHREEQTPAESRRTARVG